MGKGGWVKGRGAQMVEGASDPPQKPPSPPSPTIPAPYPHDIRPRLPHHDIRILSDMVGGVWGEA